MSCEHHQGMHSNRIIHRSVYLDQGNVQIDLAAYPVDPVGHTLLFGARKGVTRTVLTWFLAHLDHQMQTPVSVTSLH